LIFVTVGSWPRGFDRLVRAIDELMAEQAVSASVTVQVGHGEYLPRYCEHFRFCSPEEFCRWIERADIVVSHAGVGVMAEALKRSKPLVVVPRQAALGEAFDDHQFSTVQVMEQEQKALVAYETEQLQARLVEARSFVPAKGQDGQAVIEEIRRFVGQIYLAKQQKRARRFRPWWSPWAVCRRIRRSMWPYEVVRKTDADIERDLRELVMALEGQGRRFDTIVFVPNAGYYLRDMFIRGLGAERNYDIRFVSVRRASTVEANSAFHRYVFKRRWLADLLRHVEMVVRLMKRCGGISQKMVRQDHLDFDPRGREILVVDDSTETGTTLSLVKTMLLEAGAASVTTACISNNAPARQEVVDFALTRCRLLRTRASRDYDAR